MIAGPEVAAVVRQVTIPQRREYAPDPALRGPSAALPWRLARSDAAAPFVGRSDQLDLLRQWLTEALSGTPRVVLLSGDAGVGKSRLVTELIAEAEAGVRPFAGRCLEDSQIPLLALSPVLDALGIDIRALADAATISSPDEHGARLAAVVDAGRALMAAAVDRPALLVLEDVQWADPTTIEFASHVAATLAHEAAFRQLPVMLLVTARPDTGSPRAASPQPPGAGERQPIDAARRARRARGVRAPRAQTGARPSEALLHLLLRATAGNPLEIGQLVGRLARAGALELRNGELFSTVREVTGLPVEADADVGAMLNELSEPAQRLVTTLALCATAGSRRCAPDQGSNRRCSSWRSTKRPTCACSKTTVHASISSMAEAAVR